MSKQKKPVAYVAPYIVGYFCLEPIKKWLGRDSWNNTVGSGKTRRECEKMCRENGYVPVRDY